MILWTILLDFNISDDLRHFPVLPLKLLKPEWVLFDISYKVTINSVNIINIASANDSGIIQGLLKGLRLSRGFTVPGRQSLSWEMMGF